MTKSFDMTHEYNETIVPMMQKLIDTCSELGVGIVVGVCFAASHTGKDEGNFMIGGGASITESNAACHLVAIHEILSRRDAGHDLAHLVLDRIQEAEIAMRFVEENKEEIAAKVREIFEKHFQAGLN